VPFSGRTLHAVFGQRLAHLIHCGNFDSGQKIALGAMQYSAAKLMQPFHTGLKTGRALLNLQQALFTMTGPARSEGVECKVDGRRPASQGRDCEASITRLGSLRRRPDTR